LDLNTYKLRREDALEHRTLRRHLIVLSTLDRFLKDRGKEEPGEQDVHRFFDALKERGVKSASLKQYYYIFKAYTELVLGERDMLKGIGRRFRSVSRREQTLTKEEVRSIIRAERDPMKRAIYSILYSYARRIGEVLALRRRDIDLDEGRITFQILKRSGERVSFKLDGLPRRYIQEYFDRLGFELKPEDPVFPVTERAVNIALGKVAKRAGLGYDVSAHWFRHARVTHLRMQGVHDKVIQERLTLHKSIKTLQDVYSHSFPFEVEDIPGAEEALGSV